LQFWPHCLRRTGSERSLNYPGGLFAMPQERAGPKPIGIILAAVVLLLLLGLVIYLAWREANSKPKAVPQPSAEMQPIARNTFEVHRCCQLQTPATLHRPLYGFSPVDYSPIASWTLSAACGVSVLCRFCYESLRERRRIARTISISTARPMIPTRNSIVKV